MMNDDCDLDEDGEDDDDNNDDYADNPLDAYSANDDEYSFLVF